MPVAFTTGCNAARAAIVSSATIASTAVGSLAVPALSRSSTSPAMILTRSRPSVWSYAAISGRSSSRCIAGSREGSGAVDVLGQHRTDDVFWNVSHDTIHRLSALEQNQTRNAG